MWMETGTVMETEADLFESGLESVLLIGECWNRI